MSADNVNGICLLHPPLHAFNQDKCVGWYPVPDERLAFDIETYSDANNDNETQIHKFLVELAQLRHAHAELEGANALNRNALQLALVRESDLKLRGYTLQIMLANIRSVLGLIESQCKTGVPDIAPLLADIEVTIATGEALLDPSASRRLPAMENK